MLKLFYCNYYFMLGKFLVFTNITLKLLKVDKTNNAIFKINTFFSEFSVISYKYL